MTLLLPLCHMKVCFPPLFLHFYNLFDMNEQRQRRELHAAGAVTCSRLCLITRSTDSLLTSLSAYLPSLSTLSLSLLHPDMYTQISGVARSARRHSDAPFFGVATSQGVISSVIVFGCSDLYKCTVLREGALLCLMGDSNGVNGVVCKHGHGFPRSMFVVVVCGSCGRVQTMVCATSA